MTQKAATAGTKRAPQGRPLVTGRVSTPKDRGVGVPAPATGSLAAGLLVALALGWQGSCAGHEASFYPSFYPQEIRIETVDPAAAAAGWPATRVHAYVGADLFAGGPMASDAVAVNSLHSYLVLTFDAVSGRYAAATSNAPMRCAAADKIRRALVSGDPSYVVHPYPVTPYHADYLEQFDLAQRAQAPYSAPPDAASSGHVVSIRTIGRLADRLVPAAWKANAGQWDATLEEVDVDGLSDRAAPGPGGWLGLPWTKLGWFRRICSTPATCMGRPQRHPPRVPIAAW